MRILYLVPALQHPALRGPTRHYHFVRELSARHRISLLALTRAEVPAAVMQELSSYTEKLVTFRTHDPRHHGLVGGRLGNELQVRAAVAAMRTTFRQLLRQEHYDAVLFHGKHLFPVIADCDLPIVADFCDATSMRIGTKLRFAPWPRKPLLWLRYRQVRRIEARLASKTPHVAFITARDRDVVLGPGAPATILPNGLDHRYWKRRPDAQTAPHTIVFTGVMDYTPNEDAALHLIEDIAPLVRRAIPDLEVLIVGRDPSRRLRDAARRSYGVQVTGFVEDMRPYLERATVCVAPLRYASGMQNKVLEALAMQLPVIATPVVADGLRLNGAEPPVLTAGHPRAFAEAIVRLLRQPAERERLSWQGRRYVENHFCWRRSAEILEQMFFTAVREAHVAVVSETHPKHQEVGGR